MVVKSISMLIVWSFVFSSLAGLFLFALPEGVRASSPSGDVIIGEDYPNAYWEINGTICNMRGNLIIRSGGIVNVVNGGIVFNQDTGPDGVAGTSDDHVYTLVIEDGGKLILNNSILTTNLYQINAFPSLGVVVRNNGILEVIDSTLKFPGHILIDNSTLIMRNSRTSGHSASDIIAYCDQTQFPVQFYDDFATIALISSEVYFYDCEIEDLLEGVAIPTSYDHQYQFAWDDGSKVTVVYNLTRNVNAIGTSNTAIGELSDLLFDDSNLFAVAPGEILATDGINLGGLAFDKGDGVTVTLYVKYKTDPGYDGSNVIEWSFRNGASSSSGIQPSDTAEPYNPSINEEVTAYATLPDMSSTDLSKINITFENDDSLDRNVYFNRIWVGIEIPLPSYRNITLVGSTKLTAINTYLSVDFSDDPSEHNQLIVRDSSVAYLYGVYADMEQGTVGASAYLTEDNTLTVLPYARGGDDDTGQPLANLMADDNNYYSVVNGATMHISGFNASALSGDLSDVVLHVKYMTTSGFSPSNYVQYSLDGVNYFNTSIRPIRTTIETEDSFDLLGAGIKTCEEMSDLQIRFVNDGGDLAYIETIWIEIVMRPSIYIYRWLNLTVLDSQSLPVANANVTVTISGTNISAYYITPDGIQSIPPNQLLTYLGRNETTLNKTGQFGEVLIPLLWEVVNESTLPNAHQLVGGYSAKLVYRNVTGFVYYASCGFNFSAYPAIAEEDQVVNKIIRMEDLSVDKPDLLVESLTYNPLTIYEYDVVTITAKISNFGATAVSNILVDFYDFYAGVTTSIGNATISTLSPGAYQDVEIVWRDTRSGTHTITVEVDKAGKVPELSKVNNHMSKTLFVLALLPELSISDGDISIEPAELYTGQLAFINATIHNTAGKKDASNVSVDFYAGNPLTGGRLLGTTYIDVPSGGSNVTHFTFIPTQIGNYPVYVYVNKAQRILEYSYNNNIASKNVQVELSAGPNDLVVDDDDVFMILPGTYYFSGNIIIKDNGTLIVDSATFTIYQRMVDEFLIVIQDNGSLLVDSSTLNSNQNIKTYLFDHATLKLNASIIGPTLSVMADDNAEIQIIASTAHCEIIAPSSSNAVITAVNSTFTKPLASLGGNSKAYLTSIAAPSIQPKESAVALHYRWLTVTVLDGVGIPLEGAYVSINYYVNGSLYAGAITNENGKVTIAALCDRLTSSSIQYVGWYKVNATYWYDGTPYETDIPMGVSLAYYATPLARNDKSVVVSIQSALPDLDPPFWVSDTSPARGQSVVLTANITNSGVVPANGVVVRFYDNASVISNHVIALINPGETVTVNTTWVAGLPLGEHNLSVVVDPDNLLKELDESNNVNYTLVYVRGVAQLRVTTGDLVSVPTSPVTNSTATIVLTVRNEGDITAENVNVTFYQLRNGGSLEFVGYTLITRVLAGSSETASISWIPSLPGAWTIVAIVDEFNEIEETTKVDNIINQEIIVKNYGDLTPTTIVFSPASPLAAGTHIRMDVTVRNIGESTAGSAVVEFWLDAIGGSGTLIDETFTGAISPGQTVIISGEWDVEISSGLSAQTRTIYVVVNPDLIVSEISYSNNIASQQLVIYDTRPDILFLGGIEATLGGTVVDELYIGETVVLGVEMKNSGYASALGVSIAFYAIDADLIPRYLGSITKDFGVGATITGNLTWTVNLTAGTYSIVARIDPNGLIDESNEDNNELSSTLNISIPTAVIIVDLGNTYTYKAGEDMVVSGRVKNQVTGNPLSGIALAISLVDSNGDVVSGPYTVTTNQNGYYNAVVYIPISASGSCSLVVTATISGEETDKVVGITIEKGFTETGIEWWVYALIIAIVAAIIIAFSVYLYKYGLGKMVECGECGALIPESSRRCPKCGVEFESGTVKCSECGAWIPANSSECPECGAKFITEPLAEEEDEYMKKMREQYNRFIEVYREQARSELGKKYSEEKFREWWKKQPTYISFEKWLSQEEERRKLGAFACPVCGTLNARGSTVCHKCGTVFEGGKEELSEAPPEEEKRKPLRRIIKRPAEKKEGPEEKQKSGEEEKRE
ncbi:MAG: CARDB domain-containing protein [Methanomassiliicoccales archaeon]